MNRFVSIGVAAALGLAVAACSQTQTTPEPGTSEGAIARDDVPRTAEPTAATTAPAPDTNEAVIAQDDVPRSAEPSTAATPAPQGPSLVGHKVETPDGENIASVADVVLDDSGKPAYILISDAKGDMTPMPYTAASSMLEDDVLVVERARFDAAPKLKQGALAERSVSTVWQNAADSYWGRGSVRTASPLTREPDRG